jgi:quinol monooxygenase YgiN
MAVRIIVSMTAAAGKRDALMTAFRTLCPSVQQEPGCQQYEFYQSLEGTDRFVLLERNLNLDALRSHRAVERFSV